MAFLQLHGISGMQSDRVRVSSLSDKATWGRRPHLDTGEDQLLAQRYMQGPRPIRSIAIGYLQDAPRYLNQSSTIAAFAKTCTTPEYPRPWCVSTPSDMFPDRVRTIGYKMYQHGPSATVSIIQLVPGSLANPTANTSADTSL